MMRKLVIAVDCDDVLAHYATSFIEFSNRHYGTRLTLNEYTENWSELWGVDKDEVSRRAIHIRKEGMLEDMKYNQEAYKVLKELKESFRLIVVTSRRLENKEVTVNWINKFFPEIFESINFAGIWDEPDDSSHLKTKGDICVRLGADYLIDDQIKHCRAVDDCGIKALLFGSHPWNHNEEVSDTITRVAGWDEVAQFFTSKEAV